MKIITGAKNKKHMKKVLPGHQKRLMALFFAEGIIIDLALYPCAHLPSLPWDTGQSLSQKRATFRK